MRTNDVLPPAVQRLDADRVASGARNHLRDLARGVGLRLGRRELPGLRRHASPARRCRSIRSPSSQNADARRPEHPERRRHAHGQRRRGRWRGQPVGADHPDRRHAGARDALALAAGRRRLLSADRQRDVGRRGHDRAGLPPVRQRGAVRRPPRPADPRSALPAGDADREGHLRRRQLGCLSAARRAGVRSRWARRVTAGAWTGQRELEHRVALLGSGHDDGRAGRRLPGHEQHRSGLPGRRRVRAAVVGARRRAHRARPERELHRQRRDRRPLSPAERTGSRRPSSSASTTTSPRRRRSSARRPPTATTCS